MGRGLNRAPRSVFLGTPGPLASGALDGLLRAGAALAGVVSVGPAPAPPELAPLALPVAGPADLASTAAAAGLDHTWSASAASAALLGALHRLDAEHVVVACLATILPATALSAIRLGFWNIHPSSLPRHRGPAPMFWQLRGRRAVGGVSVHRMTGGIDNGPVAARARLALTGGISEVLAEYRAGLLGGMLAATALRAPWRIDWRAQRPGRGHYQAQPRAGDFRIEAHWPVARAWRFMRGARWRGQPFPFAGAAGHFELTDALEARRSKAARRPARGEVQSLDGALLLGLADGALLARGQASAAHPQQGRPP